MISKIIQKEKERQRLFLSSKLTPSTTIACHKHSLINLKEYMEEELEDAKDGENCVYVKCKRCKGNKRKRIKQLKKDIKELTKMIEAYS